MAGALDDVVAPLWILSVLFAPMVFGVLVIPMALYFRGVAGWGALALVLVDYLIPMSDRPWPLYHDGLCTAIFNSCTRYVSEYVIRIDPGFSIDKERRYLFCAHPHGIFGFYILAIQTLLLKSGVRMTAFAAPVLTLLPLARRHFSWLGIVSADAPTMRKVFKKAASPWNAFWSTPGGIEEMFCVPNPDEQIVVQKRKGFCKIALQCGMDLVPVYGFGNNQLFPVASGRGSLLAKISKAVNVTVVAWTGRWGIPYSFAPVKHNQLVAVGPPIPVERCPEPTQEQVDELHAKYCAAIRALFDRHKSDPALEKTGFAQRKLYFENEARTK